MLCFNRLNFIDVGGIPDPMMDVARDKHRYTRMKSNLSVSISAYLWQKISGSFGSHVVDNCLSPRSKDPR